VRCSCAFAIADVEEDERFELDSVSDDEQDEADLGECVT
jgi:hypothetical protein